MEILQNEHFALHEEKGKIYINVFKIGYPLLLLNSVLSDQPRVSITKFMQLKEAIEQAKGELVEVGELKPEIECVISVDAMTAKVKINVTEDDLKQNYSNIVSKVLDVLHSNHVREGILADILQNELSPVKEIVVAKGIEPQDGEDAKVKLFKCSERKPTIKEDGKADYYDMNFIDEVKKGDFLGEKLPPTEGKPGKTVTGEILVPKRGRDQKLFYDPQSVGEYQEEERLVLRALLDGVVEYQAGRLVVGDHLVIKGDVGVETGNIDFQGSITIKGIVKEGYSVKATKDISIMSELGVSGINRIESLNGDVFIKGGIFGKGTSVVIAAKNIFVKYTNEAVLEAGENINIGYYSVGSVLKAKNILTDGKNGKLIGGIIEATGRIRTGVIGNKLERKTILNVSGFDREKIQQELDNIISTYKEKVQAVERLKRKLDIFESFLEQLNPLQHSQYIEVKREFDKIMIEIFQIEERKKSLLELLETKGEGEISIGLIAFPETLFNIKNLNKRLNQATKGTFYAQGNSLHFE